MQIHCTPKLFEFEAVEGRAAVAESVADDHIECGSAMLGQLDRDFGLMWRFAPCFTDRRDRGLSSTEL